MAGEGGGRGAIKPSKTRGGGQQAFPKRDLLFMERLALKDANSFTSDLNKKSGGGGGGGGGLK